VHCRTKSLVKKRKNKRAFSKKKTSQRRARQIRLLLAVVLIAFLGAAGYLLYLYLKIEDRFSQRLWNIPSRFYSDTTLLQPGKSLGVQYVSEKLSRLGYRALETTPKHAGEYHVTTNRIDVVLRGSLRQGSTEPVPISIFFQGSTLRSLVHSTTQKQLHHLELEPEEITQSVGSEGERRYPVSLRSLSRYVIPAVLAAEDRHFYQHHGIDLRSMARALIVNARYGSIQQGGSTITQQLVKNVFLSHEKSLSRKIAEAIMALMIELRYSKDAILELYLNEIYFGQKGTLSLNGIREAAAFYFGKDPADLSLAESALIAGLIKAPNTFSPFTALEQCRERRNSVLRQMFECGFISEREMTEASERDIVLAQPGIVRNRAPYFTDYVYHQVKALFPVDALSQMGMSFYTTLDLDMQAAAEQSLNQELQRIEERCRTTRSTVPHQRLQAAVLIVEPHSGAIRAMVGGRSYAESQFNRITQAKRQPGSAFKPFVVASALDRFTPASLLSNRQRSYRINGQQWTPHNYEPIDAESITVRTMLSRSVNLAAIDLALRYGLPQIVETARLFGFTTPLYPYPSLAIGASDVIPLELAYAYTVFANGGILHEPTVIKKVLDQQGREVKVHHPTVRRVLSPEKAFIMNSLLRSVVTDGTARSLRDFGIMFPVAGKTGTTNDGRDAWFIGYTPELLCLVWVGYDDARPTPLTGASAAVPLWAQVMKAVAHRLSGSWYQKPEGIEEVVICTESGSRSCQNCSNQQREFFLSGTTPPHYCHVHCR